LGGAVQFCIIILIVILILLIVVKGVPLDPVLDDKGESMAVDAVALILKSVVLAPAMHRLWYVDLHYQALPAHSMSAPVWSK